MSALYQNFNLYSPSPGNQKVEEQCVSPNSHLDISDIEEDISVGDNRSEASTPKVSYFEKTNSKTDERSSPNDYGNTRTPPKDYENSRTSPKSYGDSRSVCNSPYKDDENEFEHGREDLKLYEAGLFHLYRQEKESNKDDNESAFAHLSGSITDTIYGRSMDLTKNSFQSQLLAGFAASVIAGTQREGQDGSGKMKYQHFISLFYLTVDIEVFTRRIFPVYYIMFLPRKNCPL